MKKKLTRRSFMRNTAITGAGVALVSGGLLSIDNLVQASSDGSGVKYGMIIDNTKCIGCGLCKQACTKQWDLPEDESFIRVFKDYPVGSQTENMTAQCNHCENAPCARICPTKATHLNEDGIMIMEPHKCVGCKGCVIACPYGARTWSEKYKVPEKCRFCDGYVQGGHEPACVVMCPVGARTFGNLNDANSDIAKMVASEKLVTLRPELGTEPKIYYKRKN